MTLYWRLFIWFFTANLLTVAVTFVVASPVLSSMEHQYSPLPEAETAVKIYEEHGERGLHEFLRGRHNTDSPDENPYCMLVDEAGRPLAHMPMPRPLKRNIMELVMETNQISLRRGGELRSYAIEGKQGKYFWVAVLPPPSPEKNRELLMLVRIISGILVVIIIAWLAARWLTGPINRLRNASLEIANGDLSTRVDSSVSRRSDELGELARDFDNMAHQLQALIDSNQRLIRDISHELRTPLARLHVALELARDTNNPSYLDRISKDAQQIDAMLTDILTLSRLELGSNIPFETFNLETTLSELVNNAAFEASARDIQINFNSQPHIHVHGNAALIASAIENVVRNAIRYSPDNSEISVSLSQDKSNAIVVISDNGPGVPEHELPNIFRPFHRVSSARERKTGGHGVGLAICAAAVAAHSGTVKASNRRSGGLQVNISFPRPIAID